jgi:ABC-2 type transport system ATP-binding protein
MALLGNLRLARIVASPSLQPGPASVLVRDLTLSYGGHRALSGVGFFVRPGEIFGLLGPNGAGKTSTLECLLGLRRPDAGAVEIGGVDARSEPARARRMCGAQLQTAALQDKITPLEAVSLFSSFYEGGPAPGKLIADFGLGEKASDPFDSLSSGQRQRLFLALAFVSDPRLLVFDEPTAGLDPRARRELHGLIRGMRADGRTVLMSTHDLDEAERLCDTVGILDRGRMVAVGPPSRLIGEAGGEGRIRLRTLGRLRRERLAAVESVSDVQGGGEAWVLRAGNLDVALAGILRAAGEEGARLVELRTEGPSLEDVFMKVTGRVWPCEAPGGGPA